MRPIHPSLPFVIHGEPFQTPPTPFGWQDQILIACQTIVLAGVVVSMGGLALSQLMR
jgi:hypothetical protein